MVKLFRDLVKLVSSTPLPFGVLEEPLRRSYIAGLRFSAVVLAGSRQMLSGQRIAGWRQPQMLSDQRGVGVGCPQPAPLTPYLLHSFYATSVAGKRTSQFFSTPQRQKIAHLFWVRSSLYLFPSHFTHHHHHSRHRELMRIILLPHLSS